MDGQSTKLPDRPDQRVSLLPGSLTMHAPRESQSQSDQTRSTAALSRESASQKRNRGLPLTKCLELGLALRRREWQYLAAVYLMTHCSASCAVVPAVLPTSVPLTTINATCRKGFLELFRGWPAINGKPISRKNGSTTRGHHL